MAGEKRILRSWKELAAYLHRTARTCQRWEREFGLPIHREDEAPQASVYAYTDELDAWLSRKFHEPEIGENQHSIAVLPFVDIDSRDSHERFCDGLAAALIDMLSQFQNLRVCALTSVLCLKGEKMDVREIGQRLRVGSILEGCLQIRGKAIELSASLADARDGFTVWAQRYAGHMDDLAPIEEDIVDNIVRILRLRSRYEGYPALKGSPPRNSEAFRLYIRGRYFWDKLGEKELNKSIVFFQEALKLDGGLAPAYAGLADSYLRLASFGYLPPKEVLPKAKMATMKALMLNGVLREALTVLAVVEWLFDYNPADAGKHFRRALDLYPNSAETREWHGNFLISMGQWDEGMAELEFALELDPLSLIINCSVAHGYYQGSDFASAESQGRHCLGLAEDSAMACHILGSVYLEKGMFEAARREFQNAVNLSGRSPHCLARLACTQALAGEAEGARQILKQILNIFRQRYVDATDIAEIYTALADYEKAIRWLERAFENRAINLIWIKCNPIFRRIQSDPRFRALEKKMGLER